MYPFAERLKSDRLTIIAECKKGSPSAGVLRADYNAKSIAKVYSDSGASAISVLTDRDYFFGSLSDLSEVATSVALPVIRKDFIIDESQIEEAYAYGASAILLIVRILDQKRLGELFQFAKGKGLGVLVETHNREEVERCLSLGIDVIGINTRDLDTFTIHPELVEELAPLVPKTKVCVAESGIQGPEDFFQYQSKVDSVLIGTYFMKQADIASAFSGLLNKSLI
ncbi:indole-3-glycerol phosphate synthase [Leptospira ryugenii]|uniref:indole-3-glycerol-phosphate synthase n=1 Tax=Leptospira ryugenii TaxID=1917863 RepID=A0A2P2DVJ2_9LEPT|nr:indole-3-glycerol phosphate synthase [Leptospira ryugenii]